MPSGMVRQTLLIALGALALGACSKRITTPKTEASTPMTQIDSVSYALGIVNGEMFAGSLSSIPGDSLQKAVIMDGFRASFLGESPKMNSSQAKAVLQGYIRSMAEREEKVAREKNESYLAEYARGEGVQRTETGLMWRELRPGKGEHPTEADTVVVHYIGRTTDGKEFDNSYRRGQAARLPLSDVIKGWTEGIALMTPGAKYELCIPSELGYGARGAGAAIPPHATLLFEIELLEVIKGKATAAREE